MTGGSVIAAGFPAEPPAVALMNDEDRRALTLRLVATVAGVSLLAVATVMGRLAPDQMQLAEAGKAMAALVVGAPVLARGLRALFDPRVPSATEPLVALAILAAMAGGAFGTAVLIPAVMEVGRLFEERSSLGVLAALEGIRRLRAVTAQRETESGEDTVSVEAIRSGDVIVVRPGEIFAADGTVLTGTSSLDGAAVTGESRLDDIGPGSKVFAGMRNVGGLVRIEVLASGARSLLGRVVQTLADVEQARIPFLRVFDAASRDYLPVVLTIAATVLFFTADPQRAIAVLVVACPTALLLAGPAAMVAAMTAASRGGILLKSARFLERIGEVDTLLLDKTGTVTQGIQAVRAIVPVDGVSEEDVLAAAAQLRPRIDPSGVASDRCRGRGARRRGRGTGRGPGVSGARGRRGNLATARCGSDAPAGSARSRTSRTFPRSTPERSFGCRRTRACSAESSCTIRRAATRAPPSTRSERSVFPGSILADRRSHFDRRRGRERARARRLRGGGPPRSQARPCPCRAGGRPRRHDGG